MNIKVPQTDLNQGSPRTSQVTGRSSANSSQGPGSTAVSSDTLTLTRTAEGLLKLEESLASIPDVDSTRVEAVKAAIAEGSYQVDAEKIVDRLLSIEKDIF